MSGAAYGRSAAGSVWPVAVLLLVAGVVALVVGRDLTFLNDELIWLVESNGFSPDALLAPHNGHLIALPRLVYELLPRMFGDSYLPFRILSTAALLGAGAAFYAFARPRVSAGVALGLTALVLFMGSAEVVSLSALGLPFLLSVAFGTAAIVAADHGRDGLGTAALLLSIASHTLGVVFGVGLVIYVLLAHRRVRPALAYGMPLVVYGAWWVYSLRFDQGIASSSNVDGIPRFAAESAAVVVAAISGISPFAASPIAFMQSILPEAAILVALTIAALAIVAWRRGWTGAWVIATCAMLLVFWVTTGLAENDVRQPTTPRYVAVGAVLALLAAVALLERIELPPGARVAGGVLIALAITGNVVGLVRGVDELNGWSDQTRAQQAALTLAAQHANPAFAPGAITSGGGRVTISAGDALALAEETGVGRKPPTRILTASPELRAEADLVLTRALGVLAVPATPAVPLGGANCRRGSEVELSPGTTIVRADRDATLGLRRFGAHAVPIGAVAASSAALLDLPDDDARQAWVLSASTPVRTCRR